MTRKGWARLSKRAKQALVARLCYWDWIAVAGKDDAISYGVAQGNLMGAASHATLGHRGPCFGMEAIPDYLNDLNAIKTVIGELSREQVFAMCEEARKMSPNDVEVFLLQLTAEQMCELFVITSMKGDWK